MSVVFGSGRILQDLATLSEALLYIWWGSAVSQSDGRGFRRGATGVPVRAVGHPVNKANQRNRGNSWCW